MTSTFIGKEVYSRVMGSKFSSQSTPLNRIITLCSCHEIPDWEAQKRAQATHQLGSRCYCKRYLFIWVWSANSVSMPLNRIIQISCWYFSRCPTWGYPTETAYYRDASSSDAILSIKIPFLAISAIDDPVRSLLPKIAKTWILTVLQIAVKEAIPFEEFRQNPNTILLTTSLGGHLCWFEPGGSRWHPRPVCITFRVSLAKAIR